ncbi:hypothetical protein IFM89_001651 [Coptis chinensis]|uniref:Cysteine protease n=1 Tax=Coptis chinensis TaxID=261450 RepID=A0A835HFM2_9MAGN|nr:hypothetical protein IFM89_001651 [Coptis chinensis]
MKEGLDSTPVVSDIPAETSNSSPGIDLTSSTTSEKKASETCSKVSYWSSFFASTFSFFDTSSGDSTTSCCEKKTSHGRTYGWTFSLKRLVGGGSMRRLHERLIGSSKTGVSSSSSDIWLLGVCYRVSSEESSDEACNTNGLYEFSVDFSSRIWMTYRKGFDAIGDSKFTSDVNWGCMLRSSQMLVAQALLFHNLGRSWRKPMEKPFCSEYIEILDLFGDSEASAFSIHNLLQVGKAYGLAAGSWIGPYAMCRSWETLVNSTQQSDKPTLSMTIYVVSGDENGERGGAPVLCIEDVAKLCSEFCEGQAVWKPILLLVPLVLGLDKVNPRYIPSLCATFTFPQSLGILGGKPGVSTYIVGVQDDKAFYLDPHEVQQVMDIKRNNSEVDTSSYHCSVVRHLPLDTIDPSLAIGFYCRDKDDFDDFCARASKLTDASNGAPLLTITKSHSSSKTVCKDFLVHSVDDESHGDFEMDNMNESEISTQEDDWQLL